MITLRDYQQECIDLINSLPGGRVLVSMATGLGKTVVFSRLKRRGRVLILSHREELVYQPIKYYDCPCGIEQAKNFSHGEEVVSASVQSIHKRLKNFKPNDFDIIITDEAHHSPAKTYREIYNYFKPRLHVGFTATPNRGDKVRLDDIFDDIIFMRDLKWGIKNGWLTDINCLRIRASYSLKNVRKNKDDFVAYELDKAVNNTVFNKQVGEIYKKYAVGQTLIFASSVEHATNIASEIKGAVVVSQGTKNRKEIIDKFTNREIPCLVNCMIFTEGTDIPLIETIIIARPTRNASLYTQMVGRGLRKSPNKKYLTLIDCVGVTEKNEICQAPSLMGLDMNSVPDYRQDMVQGMLTNMPSILEEASSCPKTWVLNAESVNLFAREQKVDLFNINWTKKPNGDLVYQFNCGDRIGIEAIDDLGKTCLLRYYFNEKTQKFEFEKSQKMSLQDASYLALRYFSQDYENEKIFWDKTQNINWYYEEATEKQLAYIKNNVETQDYEQFINGGKVTKQDASQVINMLKIRNLKNGDLLRLRQKSDKEKQKQLELEQSMSKLKIREIINKKKVYSSYYAIKHPTDLVITNDWDTATEIIAELNNLGSQKARFKKFSTKQQAQEFLRK